jgi:YbbR domain-containing protein
MSLRNFFQHNLGLKIFSLFLATLIWVSIQFGMDNNLKLPQNLILNVENKGMLHLPVGVLTASSNLTSYVVSPNEVLVSLTGDAAAIRELTPRTVKAYVDLTQNQQAQSDVHTVRVHLPAGVTLLRVVPQSVRVEAMQK